MKSILVFDELKKRVSLSARRVWIEIHVLSDTSVSITSLSARRVWIEITSISLNSCLSSSLSARRVWIEIGGNVFEYLEIRVTLREEGVD